MVNNPTRVTAVFAALADPTRRRILAGLATRGEGPVSGLIKPLRISPPAVSRHLRVLEKARLIDRRHQGRTHLIRMRSAGLKPAQDWMAQCAAGWDFSFGVLDQLLKDQQMKGNR